MPSGPGALVGSMDWRASKTLVSVIEMSLSVVEGVGREEMGGRTNEVVEKTE